jgi:hypothetical protein
MSVLKHMVISGLIEPNWISLEKAQDGSYKLKLQTPQQTDQLKEFISSNCLTIEKENGYWLISKP